eukprot:748588-Hanusia_phi.AAC.1
MCNEAGLHCRTEPAPRRPLAPRTRPVTQSPAEALSDIVLAWHPYIGRLCQLDLQACGVRTVNLQPRRAQGSCPDKLRHHRRRLRCAGSFLPVAISTSLNRRTLRTALLPTSLRASVTDAIFQRHSFIPAAQLAAQSPWLEWGGAHLWNWQRMLPLRTLAF